MTDLTGKTAVIFNGENFISQGIESALTQAGAQVIYAYTKHVQNDDIPSHGRVYPIAHDDPELLTSQIEAFGAVDLAIISCDSIWRKPFLETSDQEWDSFLAYYFERPLWASQAFARTLIKQNCPGSIIFLSSIAGKMPFVGMSVAGTSLGALRALAKMAAVDLGPHGITVNVIERGWSEGSVVLAPHKAQSIIEAATPTGKIVDSREIGDLCCFLASDAARSITGQFITLDGGYTLTAD